ncbi:MAG: hypothetical protein E7376_00525 [Clostridiales bacterium]|nr:hypothetical protein [Clostridiales bacterium]
MTFSDLLSKKLNGKYDYLKVLKVVYNTTFSLCKINFIYPESMPVLSDGQKEEIRLAVLEVLGINGKLECKFNKSYLDEKIVKNKVEEFLKTEFDSISSCVNKDLILYKRNNFVVELTFYVNDTLHNYFIENSVCDKLKNFLNQNFCGEFVVGAEIDNSEDFDEDLLEQRAIEIQSKIEIQAKTPRYKVSNVNIVFGSEIMPMPEYIKNITGEKTSVILAGIVSNLEEKEFLPKRNKVKGIDEKRKMYKFKLSDADGSVSCIHFCSKTSQKHFVLVEEGKQILCLGDYIKRLNGEMQYNIKAISLCSPCADEPVLAKESGLEEIATYKYVKPLPYTKMVQDNLFAVKKDYPDWIMNNTFVVFDVETTGLKPDRNDITEIGAVKIVNGEIVETFQSLCKPNYIISEQITKLTGITNEMVANEHAPEEIIEDFLLFAGNSIMVGYNVDFDYQFIQYAAKKIERNFNNEFRDCMGDAKSKLFLPNYKLGTVVNHLGINLNNAHRALFDATATAEAFLHLSLL